MKRVVIFGPGPQFKGGIANYTTSLARALASQKAEVHVVSWTQMYPSIFPRDLIDRSSKKNLLEGSNVTVHYITNYNNPASWRRTVKLIEELEPDIVVVQWSVSIQGLPIGYIAGQLKKSVGAEIIFDLHVVAQKEVSLIDNVMLRYALSKPDSFIVHSLKTFDELKFVFPKKSFNLIQSGTRKKDSSLCNVIKLYHPVYDMFKPDPDFNKEKVKAELGLNKHVFLFFGFIRKYKGLHNVIKAFALLARERDDVSLLIVGESFWETLDPKKISTKIKKNLFGMLKKILVRKGDDEKDYRPLELISQLGLGKSAVVVNRYVGNEEVHRFFQVADCNVLFYHVATPSGVESIAYNFSLPSIATHVGHFPETINDGYNGYLAEPENIESMYNAMKKFLDNPIPPERVDEKAKEMSWKNYAETILS
ncbi:MAG TPA: glycosyltransferase family 4 protein [Melioribacteraceae bacterium]|nr:glycosyltransferase family 4 protein [Melioribacteraceae bacterium]